MFLGPVPLPCRQLLTLRLTQLQRGCCGCRSVGPPLSLRGFPLRLGQLTPKVVNLQLQLGSSGGSGFRVDHPLLGQPLRDLFVFSLSGIESLSQPRLGLGSRPAPVLLRRPELVPEHARLGFSVGHLLLEGRGFRRVCLKQPRQLRDLPPQLRDLPATTAAVLLRRLRNSLPILEDESTGGQELRFKLLNTGPQLLRFVDPECIASSNGCISIIVDLQVKQHAGLGHAYHDIMNSSASTPCPEPPALPSTPHLSQLRL